MIRHTKKIKKYKDIKNIDLDDLSIYDSRYIKTKTRTYGDKVCTNFQELDVSERGVECKYFTVVSVDSLLVCDNIYSLELYLVNCFYEVVNSLIIDYLDVNLLR